jgi:hypothetical protein
VLQLALFDFHETDSGDKRVYTNAGFTLVRLMYIIPCGYMAGPGNNPVQVYRTGRANHWEFLRLRTGFELPSSWVNLPGCGSYRNRSGLDFMRWSDFDLGAEDLNDIQRPKYFSKK